MTKGARIGLTVGGMAAGIAIIGLIWYLNSGDGKKDPANQDGTAPPDNLGGGNTGGGSGGGQTPPVNPLDAVVVNTGIAKQVDGTVSLLFNDKKNIAVFYSNGRFVITANPNNGYLQKGYYQNGGKTMTADTGKNVGRKVTNTSVFANLINIFK